MAETEFDRRGRHAEVAEVRDRRQPLPCKAEVVAEEVDPDWRYGPKLGAIPGWMKSVAAVAKRADREQEVSSCPSVRWWREQQRRWISFDSNLSILEPKLQSASSPGRDWFLRRPLSEASSVAVPVESSVRH